MLITILATILVLGVLIFVHELGHFVTAKLVDIEVPRFSIGLGPKMWGFRRGETEYVISWLPLGGYVRMKGMEEMERIEGGPSEHEREADRLAEDAVSDMGLVGEAREGPDSRSFEAKSLPARALVLSAGVLMNLLFAIVAFAATALIWGLPLEPDTRISNVVEERLPEGAEALAGVPAGANVVAIGDESVEQWNDIERALLTRGPGPVAFRFADRSAVVVDVPAEDEARAQLVVALEPSIDPVVGAVLDDSPAAAAGLREGDRIVGVEGGEIASWHALVRRVREHPGEEIRLTVEREGRTFDTPIVPEAAELTTGEGETETVGRIGVSLPRRDPGPVASAVHGLTETWDWTVLIIGFLGDLITGDASPRNLGGPILIGQVSGQVARAGIQPLIDFMAMFSINLAILNLLPIPMLDGGHLLFLAVEAVRGRALSTEFRMRLSQIGFVIVLAIMVWAIANDVLRLFGL